MGKGYEEKMASMIMTLGGIYLPCIVLVELYNY